MLDLKPKVVVILARTNDIAGLTGSTTLNATEDNLSSIIELAQIHNINVIIASVLSVSDYHRDKNGKELIRTIVRPPDQILALNERIKNYSRKKNLIYLDYYLAMVDEKGFFKEELSRDGVHPNAKGYEVMKSLVEKTIAQALEK